MNGRRALACLLGTAILAGCGGQAATGAAAAADPTNPCVGLLARDVNVLDPIAQCEQSVALANARLGWLHWPVSSIHYRQTICPPNARCLAMIGDQGWVIYTFWSGDPVMIHVGPQILGDVVTGEVVASQPEPLPDWLLEELELPAS